MTTTKNFLFDIELIGAVRLDAPTAWDAIRIIENAIGEHDANLGAWPNGEPIIAQLSLKQRRPVLVEADGEEIPDGDSIGGLNQFGESAPRCNAGEPAQVPGAGPASAPSATSSTLYALVIDDDLGTGVSVHATHEKRLAAIAGYVRDNWAAFNDDGQDDGEAPEMTDEAAQAIFEDSMAHVGFERWYVTEDCPLPTAPPTAAPSPNLYNAAAYLSADAAAHIKAHGSWVCDPGKLATALNQR